MRSFIISTSNKPLVRGCTSSSLRFSSSSSSSSAVLFPSMDLRSDTITKPSKEMMDWVQQEQHQSANNNNNSNHTTLLEKEAASITGKEAALWVASGSVSNLIALMTYKQQQQRATTKGFGRLNSEVIVGSHSHIHQWEAGSLSTIGRMYSRQIPTEMSSGQLPLDAIKSNICNDLSDPHRAVTAAVALENTHGDCGGKVLMPAYCEAVKGMLTNHLDTKKSIPLHCDAARGWNAAHYLASINNNNSAGDARPHLKLLLKSFDSASLCLSKGVGSPLGSVLVGSGEFIEEARKTADLIGSDLTNNSSSQFSPAAAAGVYALRNNFDRMGEDNENALIFARGLRSAGFVVQPTESNIILFSVKAGRSSDFVKNLSERYGVTCQEMDESSVRAVMHMHVKREEVEEFVKMAIKMGKEGLEKELKMM